MNMDKNQMLAVTSVGQNILVSASAGAGKTRVLVERLIKRCIEDRVGMDEILALTFTAAAAAEMKNRTAAGLQERYEKEDDPDNQAWLTRQMILLNSADITTISAFCLTIIRKYCSVIGLDPATAEHVLDDAGVNRYKEAAFHEALQIFDEENHPLLIAILETFAPRSEDYEKLREIVEDICTHASADRDPLQWIRNASDAAQEVSRFDQLPENVRHWFFRAIHLHFDSITEQMGKMLTYGTDSAKIMKKYDDLKSASVRLENCANYLKEENYDMFRESFIRFGEDLSTPTDNKQAVYTAAREAMYKSCEQLSAILYDSSVLISDHNESSEIIRGLCRLAELTYTGFGELKKENACMDFSDMERFAWDILNANDGAVSKLYQARLKEVMVDEFQDTSVLQDAIIRKLAKPGTIFRVGDVKQSIYRFRQAKPALMRSLMNDPDTMQITLEHNYRSMETIIRFCNELFMRLMNVPGCLDDYQEQDIVTPGTDAQKQTDGVPVRFVLLDVPAKEEDSDEDSWGKKETKAIWIASEIRRMVQEEGRSWNDFAILVRSHNDKPVLKRVFETYGIPYDIDAREGFYNSPLCAVIRSLIEWMIDRKKIISALAVLTSGIYRFDDNTLAELKIRSGKVLKGIREEHPEIETELDELLEIALNYGIAAFLSEVSLRHDFYDRLDSSSKANFDYLFETAVKLERDGANIYDLLERMQAGTDEKSSDAMSRSKDDQAVIVTTIHQSKGLQYHTVFLWSTETVKDNDASSSVLVDDELYIGADHFSMPWRVRRPTVTRIAAQFRGNLEDLEEYTRLLYVALTRARVRLIMVDCMKKAPEESEPITLSVLARRKGMSGLILSAMQDVPGLFRIEHHPAPDEPEKEMLGAKYVSELPHFNLPVETFAPSLTPSQSEFSELPNLEPESRRMRRAHGTLIHEVVSRLPNRMWKEEDLYEYDLSEDDRERIFAFGNSDLYKEALSMDIQKEFPFYVETEDIRMHGVIDFAAVGPDEIILIDFKTDRTDPSVLLSRYTVQLQSYSTALKQIYPGRTVRAYLWSFTHNTAIPVPDKD